MKRHLLAVNLALFLCISYSSAKGQSGGLRIPNFSVHSPDVTNLGVYGEYPVDYSTGVPQINIPLYSVKGSKLECPISISYHASGIKVDQESSFIGLGWILSAGGVVTRMVRGREDEGTYGFLHLHDSVPVYNSIEDLSGAGTVGNSVYLKETFAAKDLEPDLFSVSANGLSAEFCMNNSGQFVSINHEPLSYHVDFTQNLILIKDKLGNTYRFGKSLDGTPAYENTTITHDSYNTATGLPEDPVSGGIQLPSAWYLTEIISADLSDTLFFKYQNSFYADYKTVNVTRYMPAGYYSVDHEGVSHDGTLISGVATSMQNQKVPYKVLHKNGGVEFTVVRDRLDLIANPSAPLDRARISGMNVYDSKGVLLRKVVFDNLGYFNRTGTGSNLNFVVTIPEFRRKSLKLDGVRFYDRNDSLLSETNFEYDMTPLPPRNTASQDFWGYYNGKPNSTLIPATFVQYDYSGSPVYVGDNRKSDFNYMKAGSLKKIVYPTGGYTTYEFEPNYYLNSYQQQSQQLFSKQLKAYAINRLSTCDPDFLLGVPVNNTVEFTISDTVNSSPGTLYVFFSDYMVANGGVGMTVKVTDLNSSQVFNFDHPPSNMSQIKTASVPISIVQGRTYRIEARTNGVTGSYYSMCNSPFIEVGITYDHWKTVSTSSVVPEQAGGLRAKKITSYDGDGEILLEKTYEYSNSLYTQMGVGRLITEPGKNFYRYPQLYATNIGLKELIPHIWFTSESQIELGMTHGCPIDYDKVVERAVQSGSTDPNGKTEYIYSAITGDYEPKPGLKFPYNTIYYPSWKEKKLLKTIVYKSENSQFVPVKEIRNVYSEIPEDRIRTLKIIDFEPDIYHGYQGHQSYIFYDNNPDRFFYYNYYVSRGRYLLHKDTVIDYSAVGGPLLSSKVTEYNTNYDISKETLTDSKMNQIENRYRYTADLNYSTLVNKHMISLPVQQEQLINGKVRNGSILKYNSFGAITDRYSFSASSTVTPVSYNNVDAIPQMYEKRQSLTYDTTRKLVREVLDENGIKTVFIWSYHGQYPIAEIRNADYGTVEAVLGSANINNSINAELTNAAVAALLAPLRTDERLKAALVTTYTFNPALGVTSITDPRGNTSYYEYDDLGRLKLIRDLNGNVLKQYDYKYQQPSN